MLKITYHADGTLTVEGMELSTEGIEQLRARLTQILPVTTQAETDALIDAECTKQQQAVMQIIPTFFN